MGGAEVKGKNAALWRRAWQPTPVFLPGESSWTEDPGGLQSMGSQRILHDLSDLAGRHTVSTATPSRAGAGRSDGP